MMVHAIIVLFENNRQYSSISRYTSIHALNCSKPRRCLNYAYTLMTESISCPQFVTLFSADAIAKLVSRHLVFSEFVYLVADSIHVPIGFTNHNEANALVNRTRETNEEARMLNGTRDVYKIALLGSEGSGKTGKV